MRAKRFWAAALLGVLLALFAAAPVLAAEISILLDGEELAADPAPRMVNGRVLVPLRLVSEGLSAGVSYSPSGGGEVTITETDGTEIVLKIGGKEAVKDTHREGGRQVLQLDVPARIYGGYTFVPLRFVAEALGATVDWQAEARQVVITSGEFVDPDPIFVNGEGRELHSVTSHTYMTMGGWLYGCWGHRQVGEYWRLLVESRGREVTEPERHGRWFNMDWADQYYLQSRVGFYQGEPVYSEGGTEAADYTFGIYQYTVIYHWLVDEADRPAPEEGEYLIHDEGADKWYILPASVKYQADEVTFPVYKKLINNVV